MADIHEIDPSIISRTADESDRKMIVELATALRSESPAVEATIELYGRYPEAAKEIADFIDEHGEGIMIFRAIAKALGHEVDYLLDLSSKQTDEITAEVGQPDPTPGPAQAKWRVAFFRKATERAA